jgi:hypothetical protein
MKEEVMDVACILDAEHEGETEVLVCPKYGGDLNWPGKKPRPKGDKFIKNPTNDRLL